MLLYEFCLTFIHVLAAPWNDIVKKQSMCVQCYTTYDEQIINCIEDLLVTIMETAFDFPQPQPLSTILSGIERCMQYIPYTGIFEKGLNSSKVGIFRLLFQLI